MARRKKFGEGDGSVGVLDTDAPTESTATTETPPPFYPIPPGLRTNTKPHCVEVSGSEILFSDGTRAKVPAGWVVMESNGDHYRFRPDCLPDTTCLAVVLPHGAVRRQWEETARLMALREHHSILKRLRDKERRSKLQERLAPKPQAQEEDAA